MGDVLRIATGHSFCLTGVTPVFMRSTPAPERHKIMLKAFTKLQVRVATRDKGATAVEYGLLVALIAAVIVAVVVILGKQINDAFNSVSNQLPAVK